MSTENTILIEAHYLPSVQYFSKLAHYPQAILEACETYQKGSYRNRCHIVGANGLLRLSIPLKKGKNERQFIHDTQIAFEEHWMSQHWTSIRSAYGNAPFFPYYAEELEAYFRRPNPQLFDWNLQLIQLLSRLLQLDVQIQKSTSYLKELPNEVKDFRHLIQPKSHRRKADDNFQPVPYPQLFQERHGFLPNLSILDLLFCTGPQAILYLEQSFIND